VRLLQLRSILLATDLRPGSHAAERTAVSLAAAAGAALHVVHVAPDDAADDELSRCGERLEQLASGWRARAHVMQGDSIDAILAEQVAVGADTVVLGPRRQGAPSPGPLGSVTYALVRRANVPTLIVPRELNLPLSRVMVAIDPTAGGRMALAAALTWATALRHPRRSGLHTTLTALHVDLIEEPHRLCAEEHQRLRDAVEQEGREAAHWSDVETQFVCAEGKTTGQTILTQQLEDDVDLLVIGTRAFSPKPDDSLGSVSDTVTRWATRPVLLVPPTIRVPRSVSRTTRRSRLRA